MIELAYGKINISLDVVGKMANGFHELDSIMVPVSLHDTIYINKAAEDSFESNTDLQWDDSNLIYKTVKLMRERYGIKGGLRIKLIKRIPKQAGLGGGSANAAAVLRLLNRLYKLHLSRDELAQLGAELGSDVPFCVYQKAARCKGRGEKIRLLGSHAGYKAVLIKPEQGINTKEAFELTDREQILHPDMEIIEKAYVNHEPLEELLGNSLEKAAIKLVPEIGEIKNRCRELGFKEVIMTGSGSTVFVLAEKERHLRELVEEMKKKYDFVLETEIQGNF
jgi:4-diphosphocytidyl-2-C-methyl-D-erythritol kinase